MHLLHGQEGQQREALLHVSIVDVAPILIELVRRRLVRIEPERAARRLAHLLAIALREQTVREAVDLHVLLAAVQLDACDDVRPLVIATHLQLAAVAAVQLEEVVGLHRHVIELEEREALLPARLVGIGREHAVDRKAGADLTQVVDVVQLAQPVRIVDHERLAIGKINEASNLLFKAVAIVLDLLVRQHPAHVTAPGWIADRARAAADEGNGAMARPLQMRHGHEGDEVTGMQAVRRRVKTDVERDFLLVQELAQLLLIRALRDVAALFQGIQYVCQRNRSISLSSGKTARCGIGFTLYCFMTQRPLPTSSPGSGAAGAGAAGWPGAAGC